MVQWSLTLRHPRGSGFHYNGFCLPARRRREPMKADLCCWGDLHHMFDITRRVSTTIPGRSNLSSTYPTAQPVSLEEVKVSAHPQIKFHLQAQEVQQGLSESPRGCVCAMMYSCYSQNLDFQGFQAPQPGLSPPGRGSWLADCDQPCNTRRGRKSQPGLIKPQWQSVLLFAFLLSPLDFESMSLTVLQPRNVNKVNQMLTSVLPSW